MIMESLVDKIRTLVRKDMLIEACQLLQGTEEAEKGHLIEARITSINNLINAGRVSFDFSTRELNDIRASILETLDSLERNSLYSDTSRYGTFRDPRDNQEYKTIKIGNRIWLAENLNYNLGLSLWGKKVNNINWWFYNNSQSYSSEFGRLYTGPAAAKACPPGWHLTTDLEWKELFSLFGGKGNSGKHLMEGGKSGLNLKLGGYTNGEGWFTKIGVLGCYWFEIKGGVKINHEYIFERSGEISVQAGSENTGSSVRCVKN